MPARRAQLPFVGRESDLRALSDALHDAVEGQGGLFCVVAEAGMGKTRLVEQLCQSASGAAVAWGTCWRGADSLFPWLQLARSLVRAGLLDSVPEIAGTTAAERGGAQFDGFDALVQSLHQAAQTTPLFAGAR